MFYVHLFLEAMYRKMKIYINISKICPHICLAVKVLKLKKASYVKQAERMQRGRNQTVSSEPRDQRQDVKHH